MESTYRETKPEAGSYPKMMIANTGKYIVLFTEPRKGMAIHSSTPSVHIGEYLETWDMLGFTDFHGTITITA